MEPPALGGLTLKVDVRFFALYRERAGCDVMALELSTGAIVADLMVEVRRRFPSLAPAASPIVVAVNAEYAGPEAVLKDGDEVALIPPVSGGGSVVSVTTEPLAPEKVAALVRRDTSGAVVLFLGTARLYSQGRKVLYLEYESYPEMAARKLEEIRHEVKERWGVEEVAIHHRVGRIEIGEASLVVAVASPHRKEAFQACQQVIDRIKAAVPIWKKEAFEDGHVWVGSEGGGASPAPDA